MEAARIAGETLDEVRDRLKKAPYSRTTPKFITLGQREFDAMESIYDIGKTPPHERVIMGLPYEQAKRWTGVRLCQERVRTGGKNK